MGKGQVTLTRGLTQLIQVLIGRTTNKLNKGMREVSQILLRMSESFSVRTDLYFRTLRSSFYVAFIRD